MPDFTRKTYRKEVKDNTKLSASPRPGDMVFSGEEFAGVVMKNGVYKELANQSALIYEISESDKRHDKDVAEIDERLKELENRPAGGLDTMTIFGSPLILSEGEITLNYYKKGIQGSINVTITSSNWDDTIPVSELFLIRDENHPNNDSDLTYCVVSTKMTSPRVTVGIEGHLYYDVNHNIWEMEIYCPGKVEA